MGLFSTKKQVFVDSVVYNLAGPPNQRPVYLKSALMSAVFSPTKQGIGEALTKSLLKGPGINLRSFGRWARTQGYSDLVGQTAGELSLPVPVDQAALVELLPVDPGQLVSLQTSTIGVADYTYWAHQYMLVNYPTLVDTDFTVDFNKATTEITINFEGGGSVTFTPAGYDIGGRYLYASYNRADEDSFGSVTAGTEYTVGDVGDFPDTTGWTLDDTIITGDPDFSQVEEVWLRDTDQGWNTVFSTYEVLRESLHLITHTDLVADPDEITYLHRTDEQVITRNLWQPLEILIYKQGSGDTDLDALFTSTTDVGAFLPYIPIRLDNAFVSDSFYADVLAGGTKALRKATGASFAEVVNKVAENPSLGDIDYAYVVFGASLNAEDMASRRYIYEFFQEVMLGQDLSGDPFRDWETEYAAAAGVASTWATWSAAQFDEGDPLYGEPWPEQAVYPPLPYYEVRIRSSGRPTINYDMAIGWNSVEETVGSGLKEIDAKPGSLWWEVGTPSSVFETLNSSDITGEPITYTNETVLNRVFLHWQVDGDTWRSLEFRGLHHRNHIYQGNYVIIQADEALADTEESGFIIPLHEGVLKAMPLLQSTQLSVSASYLVFNCYKVVKEQWYASSWFKVVLIVVIVAVAMITGYVDPNAVGLLGANTIVGAALGFSGTAAAMAGAIANALAASIITQILGFLTTTIAGPKYGAIISTAIMFITMSISVVPSLDGLTSSLQTNFANLMEAANLLKLTLSVGNVYGETLKAQTQDIMRRTQDTITDYNETSAEITTLTEALLGGANVMNPMGLTDLSGSMFSESPNTFLGRTLLTGSEIAELSMSLVTNFTDLTLSTELPT